MLSLNMVIIASMIGAGGLGYDVLTSLRRLDIGGGLEAGVAIVVLAIELDRLSQAFVNRPLPARGPAERSFVNSQPYILAALPVFPGTGLLELGAPHLWIYPTAAHVSPGRLWQGQVTSAHACRQDTRWE